MSASDLIHKVMKQSEKQHIRILLDGNDQEESGVAQK